MQASLDQVRRSWAARDPDIDTSPMEIVGLLRRVVGQIERAVEPLYDAAQLTVGEVGLLIHLRYLDKPVIAKRLAEIGHMSRAGVSKSLARLENRGFVQRGADPRDKRASLVRITQCGKDAVDDIFPRQLAVEAQLIAGLGASRATVLAALQVLSAVVDGAVVDGPVADRPVVDGPAVPAEGQLAVPR